MKLLLFIITIIYYNGLLKAGGKSVQMLDSV